MSSLGHPGRLGAAVLRLLLLPIVLIAEELIDSSKISGAFWPVYGLAYLYAAATLITAAAEVRPRWQTRVEPLLDLTFLCALDLTTGGPFSQVRKLFFVLPLSAAASLRPRYTATWGLLAIVGFLAVSLPNPDARDPGGSQFIAVEALLLLWTTAAATIFAWLLASREERIRGLARERGRLLAQMLTAAQHERRRLAYDLHDEPLQNILVAIRELYATESPDQHQDAAVHALELTVTHLREAIFQLQPLTLDQAGLRTAVAQLAQHHTARTGTPVEVSIGQAVTGVHDQLIYEIARELLANAINHAHATRIEVIIERSDDYLVVEVDDDGSGIPAGRVDRALSEGHLGLAATTDRVRGLDGTLAIDTAPGRGTIVRARIPARRGTDRDRQAGRSTDLDDRRRAEPTGAAGGRILRRPPVESSVGLREDTLAESAESATSSRHEQKE